MPSENNPIDLYTLFRRNYARCKVGPGQRVAVLSEGDQLRDYALASLAAVKDLGAEAIDVHVPTAAALDANTRMANIGKNNLSQYPDLVAQCCAADLVIDHMLLLFSPEQIKMQEAGARILMVVEPPEILSRLEPHDGIRERVEAAEAKLNAARRLRFTNDAGTSVTYELAQKHIMTEYGYTDTPGRWDHWPSGFLATVARAGGVNGRVVMQAGDILLPQKQMLTENITFDINDGRVCTISGGAEARALQAFMDSYQDPRAYAVSHIGWGLNERCAWDTQLPGILMDARAYHGNVLFSLGPDTEFGGDNDTACHLDLPMRGCSLWLDEELIVERGRVVPPAMRAYQ